MKKTLCIIAILMISFVTKSQTIGDTIISNNSKNLKLKVFYFHITNRCNTCTSIELNLRKTLFENFSTKIDSGYIDLYILNCEKPEYIDLVKKYDAYGATLAYTTVLNNQDIKTEDITGWAFQKVHKPEIFISELKNQIEKVIK